MKCEPGKRILKEMSTKTFGQEGKQNFADIEDNEIPNFIGSQQTINTVTKTTTDINQFRRYCLSICEKRKLEELPITDLNNLLSKFFIKVRKRHGGEYEPNTMTSFQRSIQRHMSQKKIKINIRTDEDFKRF